MLFSTCELEKNVYFIFDFVVLNVIYIVTNDIEWL